MRDARERLILVALVSGLMMSCASLTHRDQHEGVLQESNLTNLNPAPPAFDPPDMGGEEKPLIDSTYMQSQSDYHFTLGEAMGLEGNSERAIEEFKLTLVYDPDSVMVRLRLAIEYVRQGLVSEAIEQAETAVKMDSHLTEGRLLLGGLYSSLKMYDEALKQYQIILAYDQKNVDARVYIGAILAEQKKYEEAIEVFQGLATYFDKEDRYKPYYYIGRIRTEQGGVKNLKLAEKAFGQALAFNPSDVETVLALAKVEEMQDKESSVLKLLESYQDKFGPNLRVAQQLLNIYLEKEQYDSAIAQLEIVEDFEPEDLSVKFRLGLLMVEKKNYPAAIEKFEGILALEPQSDRSRFYLGAVYEEIKNYDEAITQFRKVPSGSGFYGDAIIHAAYLSKLQNRSGDALEIIESAIEQRDDIPQFYAFYASLLDEKKAYKEAVQMLTQAVAKFPEHTQLLFFLGSMQDRLGDTRQTIENMKKVISIDGNHIQALNYLAYTYAEQSENLQEAEALARKALSFQPKDGYILDTLGWVLFKQNKVSEAIKLLEAAYRVKSTEGIIAEHLGDAYYGNELVDKARKMYQRAIEVETDESKIKRIRQKISAINQKLEFSPLQNRQPAATVIGN